MRGIGDRHVRLVVAAQREEGQVGGARDVATHHAVVAVLLQLEARPRALRDAPDGVQAADAGVAEPREDELAGHAGADHLVVDDVRRHADERQVAAALADDLVAGGEADEVREALDGDAVAIANQRRDRIAHAGHLGGGHAAILQPPAGASEGRQRGLELLDRDGALELGADQPVGIDDDHEGLRAQAPGLRPGR